jgi:hypothetical protein
MIITVSTKTYTPVMEFRVKNIPENLWKEFKILCIREGITLNEKIIEMIREIVEKPREKG